jgi:hypothetical protein
VFQQHDEKERGSERFGKKEKTVVFTVHNLLRPEAMCVFKKEKRKKRETEQTSIQTDVHKRPSFLLFQRNWTKPLETEARKYIPVS